jgi:hypothetical protein
MSWGAIGAIFGIALSVGRPWSPTHSRKQRPIQQLGGVVLGGLIALQACRRRR